MKEVVLYLGGPGTGKSTLLRTMARDTACQIICPTCLAAKNAGGQTLYSWCCCSYKDFKPRDFKYPRVYIDEVFMFSKVDMQHILQCKPQELYMFGDPFQLKSPSAEGYFYEALEGAVTIKVINLDTYYRSEGDDKLQNILKSYRLTKQIDYKAFQLIEWIDAAYKIMYRNSVLLVGRHDVENAFQNRLTGMSQNKIIGPDGLLYRADQPIYTVSKFGAIQERLQLKGFYDKQMILIGGEHSGNNTEKETWLKPKIKQNRLTYDVHLGDVLTVNMCQGQTMHSVIVDIDSLFEFGSLYTAISRTKAWDKVYVLKHGNYEKTFQTDLDNAYI